MLFIFISIVFRDGWWVMRLSRMWLRWMVKGVRTKSSHIYLYLQWLKLNSGIQVNCACRLCLQWFWYIYIYCNRWTQKCSQPPVDWSLVHESAAHEHVKRVFKILNLLINYHMHPSLSTSIVPFLTNLVISIYIAC